MILEYHRPGKIEEAILLLSRKTPHTIPLAGGSSIRQKNEDVEVVDLQSLGLNIVDISGGFAELGAMVTLQKIMEMGEAPAHLVESVRRSVTFNQRNQATIGGIVATNTSFSPILAALLALDARLTWEPSSREVHLGEWLPLKNLQTPGVLLTKITIPINLATTMEIVSKTPGDIPQITVCGCRWTSGRLRITAMLKDHAPMVLSDGKDFTGVDHSAMNLEPHGTIFTSDYIKHALSILIRRTVERLNPR